jgi:Holliday junction resolvase
VLKSLIIGDEAELEVIEYLNSIGFATSKNTDTKTRQFYDIEATYDNKSITLEIKHDKMAAKTGNVAIEYYNSKQCKPSGIYVTKAKWWVHKIDGVMWICEVEKLINFTKTEKADKMIVGGGDKNADLFIYRVDRFTDICRDLKTMVTPEEFL